MYKMVIILPQNIFASSNTTCSHSNSL